MADDAVHFLVYELLRQLGGGFGIGLVVLGFQFKAHRLAADGGLLGVSVFNRQSHAVFVFFAVVRLRASQRRREADLDHAARGGFGPGGGSGSRRALFFLATCGQGDSSGYGQGKSCQFVCLHHVSSISPEIPIHQSSGMGVCGTCVMLLCTSRPIRIGRRERRLAALFQGRQLVASGFLDKPPAAPCAPTHGKIRLTRGFARRGDRRRRDPPCL